MKTLDAKTISNGISRTSTLNYINKVEPFLDQIKTAYEMQDDKASSLAVAEALIEHGYV